MVDLFISDNFDIMSALGIADSLSSYLSVLCEFYEIGISFSICALRQARLIVSSTILNVKKATFLLTGLRTAWFIYSSMS